MDPTILQDALRLSEVLEGAIDTSREVGHIPGLQHERNLRHGDRHVARLHRQLDALQQV